MKKNVFLLITVVVSLFFISCSKDEAPTFNDITLTHGETYQIPSSATWKSSNSLVASVSGTTITGECQGTATISSSEGSFKVTVNTKYDNVTLPSMNWNASLSTIKSEMSGRTLEVETSLSLFYDAPSPLSYYYYYFQNNGLSKSYMMCDYSNFSTVAQYIKERFYFVDMESASTNVEIIGLDPEEKIACGVLVQDIDGEYYYTFIFAQWTSTSLSIMSKPKADDLKDIFNPEDINKFIPSEAVPMGIKNKMISELVDK